MFWNKEEKTVIDVDQLREQLIIDEGQVNEVYHDHLGYATFGIGHLVLEGDPEYGLEVGTPVAEDRVIECFAKDVETVIEDCKKLHDGWDGYPQEVKQVIANMMFNMGRPRLSKFKGMKAAVDARDFKRASEEMVDSRWYTQVTNRARRLVNRMRALATD